VSQVAERGIRVFALAREMGVLPQAVLAVARRLGYDARNRLSVLGRQQRAAVKAALGRWPPEEPTGVTSELRPRGRGPDPFAGAEARSEGVKSWRSVARQSLA
jgi:hypothetical protein